MDCRTGGTELMTSEEFGQVYAAAAAEPPLEESPEVARQYSGLYQAASSSEQVVVATARRDGGLIAFAYGHPWHWADQEDEWARQLRSRLGSEHPLLDGTFALVTMARHPSCRGTGIGRTVLTTWLDAVAPTRVWLQTTDRPTPALTLYNELGFRSVGHGPDAPDGRPGRVLLLDRDPISTD